MSGALEEEPKVQRERRKAGRIHVVVKSLRESQEFSVKGDYTVRQLKCGLAERLGAPSEPLVLIHLNRILQDSEPLSHLRGQDGLVRVCMMQRSQHLSAVPPGDAVQSRLTGVADSEPDDLSLSLTSPLSLEEGLDSLDLINDGPGLFPAPQRQMERQLPAEPEIMQDALGRQRAFSHCSPQLNLSAPQIQLLLQTHPEVLELIRDPEVKHQVNNNEDFTLDNPEQPERTPETMPEQLLKTHTKNLHPSETQMGVAPAVTVSSGNHQSSEREKEMAPSLTADPLRELTATPTFNPNTPHSSLQSLLEEIMASPTLMESLLSGPHVSRLLNCLSQNPSLAEQMLLSHPLFSGSPQLQQQIRQQLPLFLNQMQSPDLLSAMLNPRAMGALLNIQQGLQILAAEAPVLIPVAEPQNADAASEPSSDSVLNNQSGSGPQVAVVTEQQQQQFVQQMLQALANTNHRVP
ncbi:ubiquilin-1-like [Aulostomus maculatus]